MEITGEETRITLKVTQHWKNKFDKSIRILLKSGYGTEDLIEKLREIAVVENEKNN